MNRKEYMFFTADASTITNKILSEIYYYFSIRVELECPEVAKKLPNRHQYNNSHQIPDSIEIREALSKINRAEFLVNVDNAVMGVCEDYKKIYHNWFMNTDENNIDLSIIPKLSVNFLLDYDEVQVRVGGIDFPSNSRDLYETKKFDEFFSKLDDIFLTEVHTTYSWLCEDIYRYVEISMIIYPLNIVINNLYKYITLKVQKYLYELDANIHRNIEIFIHKIYGKFLCSKENENSNGDEIVQPYDVENKVFLEQRYHPFIEDNMKILEETYDKNDE